MNNSASLTTSFFSFLNQPVTSLKGVGIKTAEALDRLHIQTVRDLLLHVPEHYTLRLDADDARIYPSGTVIRTKVKIIEHVPPAYRITRKTPYKVKTIQPSGHVLYLVFFHSYAQTATRRLLKGTEWAISGKADHWDESVSVAHPDYMLPIVQWSHIPEVEPVYPLTYGLRSAQLYKLASKVIEQFPEVSEWLSENTLVHYDFPGWRESIIQRHHPETLADTKPESPYSLRLAYDELLAHQLALNLSRVQRTKEKGVIIRGDGTLRQKLLDSTGFTLTQGQEQAITDITEDQASSYQMFRLLQGDVGSGKTLVALYTMLNAVECGKQAVLMAPTELLAQQHMECCSSVLEGMDVRCALLTGKTKTRQRRELLEQLQKGELNIIIGTHALFQEGVEFQDLAMVVIDEQHRFGVEQRLKLIEKGMAADVLLMTATPIPRTLALATCGDMDMTSLYGKPAGRKPVTTSVISLSRLDEVTASLQKATHDDKAQIYWICPLIEQGEKEEADEKEDLAAAEARYEAFTQALDARVGLVHSRVPIEERQHIMQAFANGEIDLLVSTTVIEVGINVPNATIMVIEHAERFGLSQLHQLRGRVGRGTKASSCLLLYGEKLGKIARQRLQIMRETEDGFRIAEEDLHLRGSGDIVGTRQSGFPRYHFADPMVHGQLMQQAHQEARAIAQRDPMLNSSQGQLLQQLLMLFGHHDTLHYIGVG